jgi:MinD-like ATPase involved in chromosome partitioning or flagellar assembly
MEPLTTAAIAVGSVIATKALEKTGEKVGEALWDKTGQFLVMLKKQYPHTVIAIEKASDQPLDYGKAVLEVESAAKADPEVARSAQELTAVAKTYPNPKLTEVLRDIAKALESTSSTNQTWVETIEKIVNFAQGDINIQSQTINF